MQQPSYLRFLLDNACAARKPVSGTFELTSRCNFRCKMCYIHCNALDNAALSRERDTAWWLAMAQQLHDCGTLTLLLTGGEPLLRPDFAEIYRRCRELGMLVSVNTNAALMTPSLIDLFADVKPMRLNVSLYGASDEAYRTLCGADGVFTRVRDNLLALRARDVDVKLNYTVTPENIDDAAQIIAFGREHGMNVQAASYLFPPVRSENGARQAAHRTDAETSACYRYRCESLQLSEEERQQRRQSAAALLPSLLPDPDYAAPHEKLRCRAGVSAFWVSWQGSLLPCGMLPEPSCDLLAQPFAEAWEQLKEKTAALCLPAACSDCALRGHCEVCAASCYAETGRTDGVPRYLCERTKAYLRLLTEEPSC